MPCLSMGGIGPSFLYILKEWKMTTITQLYTLACFIQFYFLEMQNNP